MWSFDHNNDKVDNKAVIIVLQQTNYYITTTYTTRHKLCMVSHALASYLMDMRRKEKGNYYCHLERKEIFNHNNNRKGCLYKQSVFFFLVLIIFFLESNHFVVVILFFITSKRIWPFEVSACSVNSMRNKSITKENENEERIKRECSNVEGEEVREKAEEKRQTNPSHVLSCSLSSSPEISSLPSSHQGEVGRKWVRDKRHQSIEREKANEWKRKKMERQ